jgi:hypothetical protein
MKHLDCTKFCHICEKEIAAFDEKSEQETFVRRYVGQHGHLVEISYCSRSCMMEWLKIDYVLAGVFNGGPKAKKEIAHDSES